MRTVMIFVFTLLILFSKSESSKVSIPLEREIQNLTAFAKVFGYTKYFHPSDEARQIKWDQFAILGTESVLEAKSDKELIEILESLFLPIAPTVKFTETKPDSQNFRQNYLNIIGRDTSGHKRVAWQHQGVNMTFTENSAYQSIRTNRKNNAVDSNFYLFQNFSAEKYGNQTVELSSMIINRVREQSGVAELIISIDDENGSLIKSKNYLIPTDQNDGWMMYALEIVVPRNAAKITAGVKLNGKGKIWIDDVMLQVKSQDNQKSLITNGMFDDEYYGRPVGWKSTLSGSYDFRLDQEYSYRGENSFYIASNESKLSDHLFESIPDVGESVVDEIVSGIWVDIPLSLYSENNSTLPKADENLLDTIQEKLREIDMDRMSGVNKNVRLANVIIAWNELQHFYPYFEVVGTDWEEQLKIAFKKALTDEIPEDFYDTLSSMLAASQDGHIMLRHHSISNEAGMPFLVDLIEKKVVVTHSLHKQIKPGDIIISLNGERATEVVQDQRRYISGSPQLTLFRSLRHFGAGKQGTEAILQIERNEEIKSYKVQRSSRYSNNKIEKKHLPITGLIEDGIYYVDLDRAPMDRINDEMSQIASSRGVIFDLRGYPNSNHQVIQHLLTHPDTSDQWMKIPKIIYPDQQRMVGYQNFGWQLEPVEPQIQGVVVFITDARAISYAESFMSFIEHYKLAEIVGQPTAGTNGNVNRMVLPGGYRFTWTGMKVTKHDGSQHHLIGIQPTIPVEKTIGGVREEKDEFLEKAIQVIQNSDS